MRLIDVGVLTVAAITLMQAERGRLEPFALNIAIDSRSRRYSECPQRSRGETVSHQPSDTHASSATSQGAVSKHTTQVTATLTSCRRASAKEAFCGANRGVALPSFITFSRRNLLKSLAYTLGVHVFLQRFEWGLRSRQRFVLAARTLTLLCAILFDIMPPGQEGGRCFAAH